MGEMFTSLQSECFFDYQQVGYSSLKMIFTFIYLHTKLNIVVFHILGFFRTFFPPSTPMYFPRSVDSTLRRISTKCRCTLCLNPRTCSIKSFNPSMRKTVKFSLLFLRHSFYFFHSSVIKTLTFSQGKWKT